MQNFYFLLSRFSCWVIGLCFVFQVSQTALAQDVPWFENGSIYTFYPASAAFPPIPDPGYKQPTIEAPVSFLGESCALLVPEEGLQYTFCQPFMPPFYLREENDSVYYALEDDEAFRFAYTFNAQVGDTWMYTMPVVDFESNEEIVFEVEVLETGSTTDELGLTTLRTLELHFTAIESEWFVNSVYSFQEQYILKVIEGVGGLEGLIIPIPVIHCCCHADHLYFAVCMEGSAFNYRNPMFEACTIGLEDVTAGGFNVYPNPANEVVQLEQVHGDAPLETVLIYNALGTQVAQHTVKTGDMRIPVSDLSPGIYHLIIADAAKRHYSQTLMIQRP